MHAEILKKPPISGVFEEHNFSETNDCLWVKFVDQDAAEWIGIFDNNFGTSLKTVIPISESNSVLVISNGQGYLVDLNKRVITEKTDWQDVESIIYNDETGLYLASDGLSLLLLDGAECIWTGERVSLDGITFTNQQGHVVEGVLNDMSEDGCRFSFDIITRKLESKWVFIDFITPPTNSNYKLALGVIIIVIWIYVYIGYIV